MRKYTLLKQLVHDVTNTLSSILFEIDNPLLIECVYQLRLFHALEQSCEPKTIIDFEKTYEEEINYFKKEYGISIRICTLADKMKDILIFFLLNKKSCKLTVFDTQILCEDCQHFTYKIFETDNGILNHINFSQNFTVNLKNISSFVIENLV